MLKKILYICNNKNKQHIMNTIITNHPEMHGEIENDVQATYSPVVKKYRVSSKNEIKISRGIEFDGLISQTGANNMPNKRAGWFKYYMTEKAFNKFSEENKTVLNILLD